MARRIRLKPTRGQASSMEALLVIFGPIALNAVWAIVNEYMRNRKRRLSRFSHLLDAHTERGIS